MLTPISNDKFRADFPEFANTTVYPDATLTLWLGAAPNFVNECRWGTLSTLGMELWAAHNIVLSARDQDAVAVGGQPGEMTGPVAAKAIDRVSVSYSPADAAMQNGKDFNLTTYGVRYLKMARMMGAGGSQY